MPVIKVLGKRYYKESGRDFLVPKMKSEVGEKIKVKDLIDGEEYDLEVVGFDKGDKIRFIKFRNKTRYIRTVGAREELTRVRIVKHDREKKEEKKIAEGSKLIKKIKKVKTRGKIA